MRFLVLGILAWTLSVAAGSAAVLRIEVTGNPTRAEVGQVFPLNDPNGERINLPPVDITEFRVQGREADVAAALEFARSTRGTLDIDLSGDVASTFACSGLLAAFCSPNYGFEIVGRQLQVDFITDTVNILSSCGQCGFHRLTDTSYQTAYEFFGNTYVANGTEYVGSLVGMFLEAEITSLRASIVEPAVVPLPSSAVLLFAGLGGLAVARHRRTQLSRQD